MDDPDLGTFGKLALAGATLVTESGVKTPEDGRRLRDAEGERGAREGGGDARSVARGEAL